MMVEPNTTVVAAADIVCRLPESYFRCRTISFKLRLEWFGGGRTTTPLQRFHCREDVVAVRRRERLGRVVTSCGRLALRSPALSVSAPRPARDRLRLVDF